MGGAGIKTDYKSVHAFTRLLIESAVGGGGRGRCERSLDAAYKDMGQAHTVIGKYQL